MQGATGPRQKLRRGMTLVELLVVVVIILLLAAATIPRLQPAMDRSRIREAARSVQLYLSSARNQAIATGRSCGVIIEALPGEGGCSMTLSQVESSAPLGGAATLSLSSGSLTVKFDTDTDARVKSLTSGKPNQIQFGGQGGLYNLSSSGSAATAGWNLGQSPPWPLSPSAIPCKIYRQPVKSVASALQLPSPAVIDLTLSGPDTVQPNGTTTFWGSGPVTIMFAPDGTIDQVLVGGVATHPVTPICLLIGKRENVNDPDPKKLNSQDLSCLWVAINPWTGLIITTDLAVVGDKTNIDQSRKYARESDAMGGK